MVKGRVPSSRTNGIIAGLPKEYRDHVRAALRQGWKLTQSGNGHPKLTAPDGRSTPIPSTSSAPPMFKSWLSRLRKMGLAS